MVIRLLLSLQPPRRDMLITDSGSANLLCHLLLPASCKRVWLLEGCAGVTPQSYPTCVHWAFACSLQILLHLFDLSGMTLPFSFSFIAFLFASLSLYISPLSLYISPSLSLYIYIAIITVAIIITKMPYLLLSSSLLGFIAALCVLLLVPLACFLPSVSPWFACSCPVRQSPRFVLPESST